MHKVFALPVGLVFSAALGHAAFAGPLDAATILQDSNAIIYTNASTTSDIEGAAVIGGNFSGATVYNNPTASQPAGFGALTVFGSTSGNPINLNDGGNAYVGGTTGATLNFNADSHGNKGGYIAAPGVTIGAFETVLNGLSTSLSSLAATSPLPATGNNEVITATPGANGIAVFDITASQLAAIPSFTVNLNGASAVIFNVSGTSVSYTANDESGTTGADDIIWNFYQADTVALNTLIGGTVLAPEATVTNDNQIDGTLVANSWSGTGELHDYGYSGALPTSVPEPPALAFLGPALVGLGLVRRRSPKTQAR